MSGAREQILGRIRRATTALPQPAQLPEYSPALTVSNAGLELLGAHDHAAALAVQWKAVNGRWAAGWKDLATQLAAASPALGYCDPAFAGALLAEWPGAPVVTTFERARVDEYDFAVTPAWGAVAETGTVILTDRATPARLAALATWTHVAVIPGGRVFPTMAAAVAALPQDPSIVMVTGPSKTADIEGILIEGVHGPGVQYAIVAG